MPKYKLSIITICYNDLSGLKRTIFSIDSKFLSGEHLLQVENVVIDGGSLDGTKEFLNEISNTRKLSTKFCSESDSGIYHAMNKGIMLAEGEYLLFLNSGDELNAEFDLVHLFRRIADASDDRVGGIAFGALISLAGLILQIKARYVSGGILRMPTIHQSMILKKSVMLENLFDQSFKICGDFENFLRVKSKGYKFLIDENFLSVFYSGGVSSQKPLLHFTEVLRICYIYRKSTFSFVLNILKLSVSLCAFQLILACKKIANFYSAKTKK